MSGGDSQPSQVSLFGGSEGPNSLELFSQPPTSTQNSNSYADIQNQPSTATMKSKSVDVRAHPFKVNSTFARGIIYNIMSGRNREVRATTGAHICSYMYCHGNFL